MRGSRCDVAVSRSSGKFVQLSNVPTLFVDPRIGLKPLQGAANALFNGQFGFPAGRPDFFCFEEDEWVVADPAPAAARIFEARLETESFADKANRVVDLDVMVGAEIVDLDAMLRFFGR